MDAQNYLKGTQMSAIQERELVVPGEMNSGWAKFIVRVQELDMSNSTDLKERALELLTGLPNEIEGVCLDGSNMDFIDGAGMYALRAIHDKATATGKKFKVIVPSKLMRGIRLAPFLQPVEIQAI